MNQEIAEAIIKWDEHEDLDHFVVLTDEELYRTSRWHVYYFQVLQDKRDDRYWRVEWSRGATEMQDEGPEDIRFYQVAPIQVLVTQYVKV